MSAPAVPVVPFTSWPTLRRPHCSGKRGSSGAEATEKVWSATAVRTRGSERRAATVCAVDPAEARTSSNRGRPRPRSRVAPLRPRVAARSLAATPGA